MNGSLDTNAVTVSADATLGGVGTIGGRVSVQAGGILSPGTNGAGTLTLAKSPLLGGTTLMEISKGASPEADKLVINSQPLIYGGKLVVTNIGTSAFAAGDTFALFSAASYSGNFAATNLPPLGPGLGWALTPTSGRLAVLSTVNPTPPKIACSVSSGT